MKSTIGKTCQISNNLSTRLILVRSRIQYKKLSLVFTPKCILIKLDNLIIYHQLFSKMLQNRFGKCYMYLY